VAAMCRYQAVILTADGYLPLGPAVYPETVSATDFSSLSAVGLYGADRASVFASNASSVIVDVYVDRLLNDAGGRLCVRGGRQYYLDHAYIKELDTEIEFYRSAEVEVYLRLLCASDLSEDGYTFSCDGAGFFAFDVYSEEGAYMLCAVSGYLAERYDFAAGFILGERLDAAVYNGADLSDTAAYGALCADTMRLLYNSAVAYIPDVYVIAPIGQYGSETRDAAFLNASGVQGFCDPVLLTVSLSDSIGSGGDMPWGLMYLSDSVDQVIGHTKNIAAQLRSVGRSVPRDILLFWQPEATEDAALLARYGEGCRDAMEMGARTLFLSVAQQSDPASLCASLKRITVEGDTARLLCEYDAVVGGGNRESAGRYVLNDFSHSYSTQGWMAGSGCTRLVTQADGIGGEGRSLHAVFSAESGSLFDAVSGNMICAPASGRNLRHAPYVVYSLQVITELESADTAQLVFVFGSGDERAEYTAQIPVGVPVEIGCDLGDFPGAENISYLAVSVQCDSSASVDIYDVVCLSDQYSDDELARLYRAESADEQSGTGSSMELSAPQRMLAGTVLLGSIVLLALFGRRKKEGSAL